MIWIVLAVALAAGELVWPSLFLAPLAAEAVLCAFAQSIGLGGGVVLVVFLASFAVLLSFARSIARHQRYTPPACRTGTAALVDRTALVVERVDNGVGCGSVKLEGEVWTARSWDEDEVIEAGRRVHVVEIRGATAFVSDG